MDDITAPGPANAPAPPGPIDEPVPPGPVDGSADNTVQKQRGRPFQSGQSGNPNGRPKGSRNKVTQAVEVLIHDQSEALIEKAIERALAGDANMLRVLLGTMVPVRRDRPVEFELPPINTAADALAASSAVLAECAAGTLTPSEAREVMGLITTHVRTVEVAELERRLSELEKKREHSPIAS
jgi:hypothetical protein